MTDFSRLSVAAIAAAVQSGARGAVQVAHDTLARADAYDAIQPQAWIHRLPADEVLARAAAIDARVAAGEVLPLAGVPYAVKDNIDIAGLPTTAGCPEFSYVAEASATVVARLEAAGALLIGKTNLDQFATGLVGTRTPYGACGCVYNLDYISGGSSSGSGVAVAAGLTAFSLGTDTAGSGRVPAAFNHLVGLKPTKGRWSTTGLTPACRTLDCITVFASTVADAALVDSVAAGFDETDPYSRNAAVQHNLEGAAKIGVPLQHQLNMFGDEQSKSLFDKALLRAKSLGLQIVDVDIAPLLDAAQMLYKGPWVAERAAVAGKMLRTNAAAIDPVVREILERGLTVTGVETFEGQYRLKAYERDAEALWRAVDVLLLPTAPTIYRVRELLAEPMALNSNLGLYTNFVNLLDMSAIAIPAGFRANGTGFGVTLIGPAFADGMLQQLAQQFEDAASKDPAMTPPSLDLKDRPAETVKLAVVGAHLQGMPLHWQLTSRGATLVAKTRTAAAYRLYAMTHSAPPKPALIHVGEADGAAIELEIYELPMALFGEFVTDVPAPLAIGTVTLEDGSSIKGFVAEPRAMEGAQDITALGGWRAYIASRA
jgi:allophanate hydrolase